MSLKSCYEALGGNYDEVLGRLRSERIVQKFVLKFLDDGSYAELLTAMDAKDGEVAFRAAHTIKGVCLNLGFTELFKSSERLCETLRGGWTDEALPLLNPVKEDYRRTADAIQAFKAEIGA